MGILSDYLTRRLAREIEQRRVLVWYDPVCQWTPWVEGILKTPLPETCFAADVNFSGTAARFMTFAGSYYEVFRECESSAGEAELPPLVVYIPGEPYLESYSPIRELECLGGEKEPFCPDLRKVALSAFHAAGMPDNKIRVSTISYTITVK